MRLAFLQTGDFGEAYLRLARGGPETYRDQRASVEYVARLAERHDVTVICVAGGQMLDLAPGLRAIGLPAALAYDGRTVEAALEETAPDRLIVRLPHRGALNWARRRKTPTLPVFADLFVNAGLRGVARNLRLRGALSGLPAPCIANHSLNAARSVPRALLWPARRTVPWDWSRLPTTGAPRERMRAAPRLLYAGTLSEAKGLGDALDALALLRAEGLDASLEIAGPDPKGVWAKALAERGAEGAVLLGRLAHDEVRQRMAEADAVLVPSRHDYPEGLPNVIYEALAAHAPLILSDHPAFAGRLTPDEDCLEHKAGDPADIAACVMRLAREPDLARRLSLAGPEAHDRLYIGLEWTRLIDLFLDDPSDETGWVGRHALPAYAGAS